MSWIKRKLWDLLGIMTLQDEIIALKASNTELQEKINENESAIALLSVLNARAIRDTIKYIDEIALALKKRESFTSKKKDDDFIN